MGLPTTWTLATVGELIELGPKNDCADDAEAGFVPLHLMGVHYRDTHGFERRQWGEIRKGYTQFADGDVLLARITPSFENGKAGIARGLPSGVGAGSTEYFVCRPFEGVVSPEYLLAHFKTPQFLSNGQQVMSGAVGQQRVPKQYVLNSVIPLAPLNEQKRITDKLDMLLGRVDACREHLDCIPPILEGLRRAILAAATSGKLTEDWRTRSTESDEMTSFESADADVMGDYKFPKSWESAHFADIAVIISGLTKDTRKQVAEDEELPYLRVANVQRGFLDLRHMKTIRVPCSKLSALLLQSGDILFNEGGDIDKLGRGWVWGGEIERCVFQNHVFRARLKDTRYAPKFFSWYGNSCGYDYFLSHGRQTTNLASINRSVLSSLPVPIPPPEEQNEIVRRVEMLFACADRLEKRYMACLAKVESLTPILMSKAFRGELVPQDPEDECATALLKRAAVARASQPSPARRTHSTEISTERKTRSETIVLKRTEVLATHLTNILNSRGPLCPEALWSASQLDINDFYDQLRNEEATGLLREIREGTGAANRKLEAT